jgi:hypothetical protein
MKRLHYIYCAAPLTVALNAVPVMLGGTWRVVAALALAVGLWSVTWMRAYTNKKLRPEFAVLVMLPALFHHVIQAAGPEYVATFSTPGFQNLNFFLWLAATVVTLRALLPTPQEYSGPRSRDSVFIFMTIITIIYNFSSWSQTHIIH